MDREKKGVLLKLVDWKARLINSTPLHEAIEAFLHHLSRDGYAPSTRADYQRSLNLLSDLVGKSALRTISTSLLSDSLLEWEKQRERARKQWSPGTMNNSVRMEGLFQVVQKAEVVG